MTSICQHKYCRNCLSQLLRTKPNCVVCKKLLRQVNGSQPDGGRMSYKIHSGGVAGYDQYATIAITYHFRNGFLSHTHPHVGHHFTGKTFTAYLPDSSEGREVLTLLQKAFDSKLLFTIGLSTTNTKEYTVIWNDIEHKTSKYGGQNK